MRPDEHTDPDLIGFAPLPDEQVWQRNAIVALAVCSAMVLIAGVVTFFATNGSSGDGAVVSAPAREVSAAVVPSSSTSTTSSTVPVSSTSTTAVSWPAPVVVRWKRRTVDRASG